MTRKLDKKFVLALVIITVADAVVILLVKKIFGSEVAGYVGVALATLLTAVLARFETLRFRKIPDDKFTWVDTPLTDIWRVIVIAFAFDGAEYLIGFVSGFVPDAWLGEWGLPVSLLGGSLVVYFVGSILMAKAFVRLRYSTVAFAVLLNLVFSVLMTVARPRPETIYAL